MENERSVQMENETSLESFEAFAVSPQQKRVWSLLQYLENNPFLAMVRVQIEGAVDFQRLCHAVQKLIDKYEILSTRVRGLEEMSTPFQVLGEGPEQLIQWDKAEPSAKTGEALLWQGDPAVDSPIQFVLSAVSQEEHHLLISISGMNGDIRSLFNLTADLSGAYENPTLDEEEIDGVVQYIDVADWMNELLTSEDSVAGLDYWRQTQWQQSLGTRIVGDVFTPRTVSRTLSGSQFTRLDVLASRHGNLQSLMACSWLVLLRRLTTDPELRIAVLVSGRPLEDLEGVQGLFCKHVPLDVAVHEEILFQDLLVRTGSELDLATRWQGCFSWQQQDGEALTPGTFFPYLFDFHQQPSALETSGLSWSVASLYACLDLFQYRLSVTAHNDGLSIDLGYDPKIYTDEAAQQRLDQYLVLLASLAQDHARSLSELEILPENQRQTLLVSFNQTNHPYPADVCMHELFEAQARRTPDNIALIMGGSNEAGISLGAENFSYADLDEGSCLLAEYLRTLGVGPEAVVALCLERSVELLVGILAIHKCGAAYLPLDPAYPPERLTFMLEDGQPVAVLTSLVSRQYVPDFEGPVITLDEPWNEVHEPAKLSLSRAESHNLAYIIYTSGSTGKPKGVMVAHSAIINRLWWMVDQFPLGPDDRVLQRTSYSFDASIWEMFFPLFCGATVVMAGPTDHHDSGYLIRLVEELEISIVQFPPSLLATLLEGEGLRHCHALKRVFCGGEALSPALAERLYKMVPDANKITLHNLYGPTESSIDVCSWVCRQDEEIPIGPPLPNTRIYILDAHMQPVPIGVPGQLFVHGAGLARGYLARAGLTAERFLPDPFTGRAGLRLYNTGDIACWRMDGAISYLGRADNQVKIRGFRIEPGEIEAVLNAAPDVRDAVVITEEVVSRERSLTRDHRLLAYVVLTEGSHLESIVLRDRLSADLPQHMVPAAITIIDELPLTPNGKLERRALPEPDFGRALDAHSHKAETPTELLLAEMWCGVLGLESVSTNESFFELGGHSLLSTQIISRIRAEFSLELSVRQFFEHPTVASLAEEIDATRGTTLDKIPLTPLPRSAHMPLSLSQLGLWFLECLSPHTSTYNVPLALRFEGPLVTRFLVESFRILSRAQEALRTRFADNDGVPHLLIDDHWRGSVRLVDLSGLSCAADEAASLLNREATTPFSLEQGPLLRVLLLRLSPTKHSLVVTMHHIITDGWSIRVLVHQFSEIYRAMIEEKEPSLPALPIQFADYSAWQRHTLNDKVLGEQLDFWKRKLGDAPDRITLPTDLARPEVLTHEGAEYTFTIPAPTVAAVNVLAKDTNTTSFMVFLAIYGLLLRRYSGQQDICIGTPYTNRDTVQVENLIGFFVNTLVLRLCPTDKLSFHELLAQVKETVLEAFGNKDTPLDQIVEAVAPEREMGYAPLYQVRFTLDNSEGMTAPEDPFPGIKASYHEHQNPTAKTEIGLSLFQHGEQVMGILDYNVDLFEAATIKRFADHFRVLSAAVTSNANHQLECLNILEEADRETLLVAFNESYRPYPDDRCLHELFEAQVMRTPDQTALILGGANESGAKIQAESCTYAELKERTDDLAAYLQNLGIGRETVVALCLDRSVELLVGILGILKCGAAYLPLDPAYPNERLTFMLADGKPAAVLTTRACKETVPAYTGPLVCLDEPLHFEDRTRTVQTWAGSGSRNLAYIIYTSGSTGRPKGVMMAHASIINRLWWMVDQFPLDRSDRVLQRTSYSFDASIWEMFFPLFSGATIVMAGPTDHHDSAYLIRLIAELDVTIAQFPPSLLATLLEGEGLRGCSALRRVFCGGEAFSPALQERLFQMVPDAARISLHNLYGPTEVSIDVCSWVCRRGEPVPIGPPLPNTQVYILDGLMQPVPIGVPGQLFVYGAGLARGYLARAGLTAERFVPNPFSDSMGLRLYNTGDIACWRSDGAVIYLGRDDNQVKVRGFRIEPGEIEAALTALVGVRDAVVIAEKAPALPGALIRDHRLLAYVVPIKDHHLDGGEIREQLSANLPKHMVPAAFTVINELPLTPNGKLDQRALPEPDFGGETSDNFQAPKTPTQKLLVEMWCEVLGLDSVSVADRFFELGGHSLLSIQVIARVREQFSMELSVRQFFENPTIATLAAEIDAACERSFDEVPLVPVPRTPRMLLSFAQERLWFLDRLTPGDNSYNMSLAIQLRGRLDVDLLKSCFTRILDRHEGLRTRFEEHEGQVYQIIDRAVALAWQEVDLSQLSQRMETCRQRIRQEAARPYSLKEGPLLRLTLFRVEDNNHVLLINKHHIVSDAWSFGVLDNEWKEHYVALVKGREPQLPELPVQYADYAQWQRNWLQGEVLEQQLAYWADQLAGSTAALDLPFDKPRPVLQTSNGNSFSFVISPEVTAGLDRLSRQAETTSFMTLLGTFAVLLARYAGLRDLNIGTPVANRNREAIEGLIGLFVNTLVLRVDLGGNATFAEILLRIRHMALDAFAHGDAPFEQVVDRLDVVRDLSRSPLFQVMFSLLEVREVAAPALDDLTWEFLDDDMPIAKFDLSLDFLRQGDHLQGIFNYNTDLFEEATIVRLVGHYQNLCRALIEQPDRSLDKVSILDEQERHCILHTWNDTEADWPLDIAYGDLFDAAAERMPSATAMATATSEMSYAELRARANQLAHELLDRGVRPEEPVALYNGRRPEMIVAQLAVLKAGGCWLCLDITAPQEHLAQQLADTGARFVLAEQSQASPALSQLSGDRQVLYTDTFTVGRSDSPKRIAASSQLAYLIFTSGTTGKPKGVGISHAALTNHCHGMLQLYGFGPDDRMMQFCSVSFDASVQEIFPGLLGGACLFLHDQEHGLAIRELERIAEENKLTVLIFSTAYAHELMRDLARTGKSIPATVRLLIMGGDAVDVSLVKKWRENAGKGVSWVNDYGPTEGTVIATRFQLEPEQTFPDLIPIGKPIPNYRVYVLDGFFRPVPTGAMGRLYIGGPGVARGYLNRPSQTAEKFVPDPFSKGRGARLYDSGDLARYFADGQIQFLGRADFQVKIRGFRVEPGEVTHVLNAHPDLEATIVVVHGEHNDKRLAAYVVRSRKELDERDLAGYLSERLPAYMIPDTFTFLSALPINALGKLDRKALPAPERGRAHAYTPPATATEEQLAAIWCKVLQLEVVGSQNNFFELGGHSLLATQVISRIRETFKLELPLGILFQKPVLKDLAAGIDQNRREQGSFNEPVMTTVARQARMPLSFAQERLWFLQRLTPEDVSYNLAEAYRLRGALDESVLRCCFNTIAERHEPLRTRFVSYQGKACQIIDPPGEVAFERVDLTSLPEENREAACQERLQQQAVRPFSLERGPLLRLCLYVLANNDHVLLVDMHHIITDGWSSGILEHEFRTLYQDFANGDASSLQTLPIQYADYAIWQRNWLQGEVLERQLAYWQEQLSGSHVLELPLDKPRPPVQTSRGADFLFELDGEIVRALDSQAQRDGTTSFMIYLATFAVLLGRYGGCRDLNIGTPIANRTRVEVENLIGFFVNTLVLRIDLGEQANFTQLLEWVKQVALNAYAHQDAPFEQVVERLDISRDLSRGALFQVMFSLVNVQENAFVAIPELQMDAFSFERPTTKFDISLGLAHHGDRISASLRYNADLFEEASMARLAGHYRTLCAAVAQAPNICLSRVNLIGEEERHKLLHQWNDTRAPWSLDQDYLHQFDAVVDHDPDRIAIIHDHAQISYGVLSADTYRLAQALLERGLRPEEPVAVKTGRRPSMIIAQLALLRAGGCWLPLDDQIGGAKLAYMIADAGVRFMLCTTPNISGEGLPGKLEVLDPSTLTATTNFPLPVFYPRQLAYIIYTSGSTGLPKGVGITRSALLNHCRLIKDLYETKPNDRVLQFCSVNFDASVKEIFPTLLSGASVILRDEQVDMAALNNLVETRAVSIVIFPTAYGHEWMRAGRVAASVRLAVVGGEAASPALLEGWRTGAGARVAWINNYGPTEATVIATCLKLEPGHATPTLLTIGRPLANYCIYLLDADLQPVPTGVVGTLYINGVGLARSYFNRPAVSAEKFIPNPFSESGGDRLYDSGDLARYLADGTIQFLGRADFQVKILGFRVEPGEVTHVLARHPDLAEAVVVAHGTTDKRLAAYVVPSGEAPGEIALLDYLRVQLPAYMIPDTFTFLESLPINAVGKLDRNALPAPKRQRSTSYGVPATPTEETLATIWSIVLQQEDIGSGDNFFELGGHSLLATQVISRIRDELKVELPLRALFQKPVLRTLAVEIDRTLRVLGDLQEPALIPTARGARVPLSFAQERLWFLNRLDPEDDSYNITMTYRFSGDLDEKLLRRCFDIIAARHEALRTRFEEVQGQPFQIIDAPGPVAFHRVDLSALPSEHRETACRSHIDESASFFSLAQGPLLRLTLYVLAEQDHVLLVDMHHIITDGWSSAILDYEFKTLYRSYKQGRENPLNELPIQYPDYASWQRDWLTGPVLDRQLAFWRSRLEGSSVVNLPIDRPRPALQTSNGALFSFELETEVVTALESQARENGATAYMTYLATFAVLLGRYAGIHDLNIGTPIANRNRAEIEHLIGFFVNTLVLRLNLHGNPCFRELLERVKQTALDAYANQDAPFERVLDHMDVERDLSQSPLFQVMFSLINQREDVSLAIPGLDILPFPHEQPSTAFDLSLDLFHQGESLGGVFSYNTDLFEKATIARMVAHYQTLCAALARQPENPLDQVSILDWQERACILHSFNDTKADWSYEYAYHDLFDANAVTMPENPALATDNEEVSYAQLQMRANQLANALLAKGLEPEEPVVLYCRRRPMMIVSQLAVLKAGGCWLALDIESPEERLTQLLADSNARFLLTEHSLSGPVLERFSGNLQVLYPDTLAAGSTDSPKRKIRPNQLAYLIYTSGTTGKPKGVGITHAALVNHCLSMLELYQFGPRDRLLQFCSVSFDASIQEIFPGLLGGATLFLQDNPHGLAIGELELLIQDHALTVLNFPTAYGHEWMREIVRLKKTIPQSVRLVIMGGDALDHSLLSTWCEQAGKEVAWVNDYGPTEATVVATRFLLEPGQDLPATITVGKPIHNYRIYLLDEFFRPVPVGARGRLYIGGIGLARAYQGLPGQTADKFVPDPFSGTKGERLYDSGDLARFLSDGQVQFLGRDDFQVKIRGFRVEPEEITQVLSAHPDLDEAIVVVRGKSDDKRLAAYVVPAQEGLKESVLRTWLQARMPAYMVPETFTMLDNLPINVQGKLDRKALPEPEQESIETYSAPRDDFERAACRLWQELLGVDRVGIDDDFFSIGGHSLLAVRLQARLQDDLRLKLPLAELFRKRTVRDLARVSTTAIPHIVALREDGESPPLFLAPPVEGEVFAYRSWAEHPCWKHPLYAFQSPGLEDDSEPLSSISSLASTFIQAMQTIQPEGPYLIGGFSLGGIIALEMAHQLVKNGQDVLSCVLFDTYLSICDCPEDDLLDTYLQYAHYLAGRAGQVSSLTRADLEALKNSDAYFQAVLQDRRIEAGEEARLRRGFYVFRANNLAAAGYQPRTLTRPPLLFQSGERPDGQPKTSKAQSTWLDARIPVQVTNVAGHHYNMLQGSQLDRLLPELETSLATDRSQGEKIRDVSSTS